MNVRTVGPESARLGPWSGFLITNHLSGDYYLDGSSREVDRLTLTRSIYDETYGQWDGTSFTAPTEGLYEFTIRMVGISSDTTGPPIILPELNGFLIDKWHCKIYGNADCQKTFQGKKSIKTVAMRSQVSITAAAVRATMIHGYKSRLRPGIFHAHICVSYQTSVWTKFKTYRK